MKEEELITILRRRNKRCILLLASNISGSDIHEKYEISLRHDWKTCPHVSGAVSVPRRFPVENSQHLSARRMIYTAYPVNGKCARLIFQQPAVTFY
jgi:hypothetical protein